MDPLRQDQSGEHLRQQNASLRFALEIIDRDIARAAARYLSKATERRYLKLKDFLNLLVLEIRRQTEEELQGALLKKLVSEEVRKKLDEQIEELMPKIAGRLSDYITIQVLVTHGARRFNPKNGRFENVMPMARSLRGAFQAAHGPTPEAAYNSLRERLALDLFASGSDWLMAGQLKKRDNGLTSQFAAGKPFRMDEVAGFNVEARIANLPGGSENKT